MSTLPTSDSDGNLGTRTDAWPVVWLAVFSLIYFPIACILASRRELWFDEICTYNLSRISDLPTLWAALSNGPDASGPLHFLSVRLAYLFLGETSLATRLPAIIGVWVMALSLYIFVSRRTPPVIAMAAMWFTLSTELYIFMVEGRSYGIYLAFTGLSLVFWQAAAAGHRRWLTLIGFTLSLAAAVASTYNAVLIFIPLGLAEITRAWTRRRIDFPMWLALVAGLFPLALCIPFIKNAQSFSVYLKGPVALSDVAKFYDWLLIDTVLPLVGALVLVCVALSCASSRSDDGPGSDESFPPLHEIVVAVGLIALPAFLVVLGKILGAIFMNRYCLPAAMGTATLIAFLAARLRGRSLVGSVLVGVFLGWFVLNFAGRIAFSNSYPPQVRDNPYSVPAGEELPVTTNDLNMFVSSNFYMNKKLCSNFYFLTGLKESLSEAEIKKLAPLIRQEKPFLVKDYAEFVATHDRFLVYGDPGPPVFIGELVDRLKSDGAEVKQIGSRTISTTGRKFATFPVFEVRVVRSIGRPVPGVPAPGEHIGPP